MKKLLLSLGLAASMVSAKDTIGRFGVGGNTTLGGITGFNFIYQTSRMLVLDATVGLNYEDLGAPNTDAILSWGVAGHAFLNFADYEHTNLLMGVGVNVGGDDADNTEGVDFSIEAPLRLVWHTVDHLAVFTQTGFTFDITQDRPDGADNDFKFGIKTDLLGQAGVTFYF